MIYGMIATMSKGEHIDFSSYKPEQFIDNDTLKYFADAIGDERIDAAIETSGITRSKFHFESESKYVIHEQLLPPNHLNSTEQNKKSTAFHAEGQVTDEKLHLELRATDGDQPRKLVIDSNGLGEFYLYDKLSPYIQTLTIDEFSNLSLKAANIDPLMARMTIKLFKQEQEFNYTKNLYNFWIEFAQQQEGSYKKIGFISKDIHSSKDTTVSLRLMQEEIEQPHKSKLKLTIEHATRMLDLDAEKVYRLVLTYISDGDRAQSTRADRRVVSGCDKELAEAMLSSIDTSGRVTELDINDPMLMRQFKTTLELLLSN